MPALDEQETTMTYDSGENLVRIYSARPSDQNKLKKAGVTPYRGTASRGYFYLVPLAQFKWQIRSLTAKKRVLSSTHPFRLRKLGASESSE